MRITQAVLRTICSIFSSAEADLGISPKLSGCRDRVFGERTHIEIRVGQVSIKSDRVHFNAQERDCPNTKSDQGEPWKRDV